MGINPVSTASQHCAAFTINSRRQLKKLIVEIDGPHHLEQMDYDEGRDSWLKKEGFEVVRITTDEFFMDEEAVLKKIHRTLLRSCLTAPTCVNTPF